MAAVGNAMDNGAELKLNFNVDSIEKCEGGFVISSGEDKIVAKFVINCAGVCSDEVARLVADTPFDVHPRRGEYLLLDRECGAHVSHTIFRCPSKMGKGVLVTPTVDGNLLVGPTAEDIEDKTDTKTTAEGLARVRALAVEQVRKIDFSKVITSFTGLRSVGSTGDFIINMPTYGFINAAGIESPGLSSAPAIAEYIASMLSDAGFVMSRREEFNPCRRPMHYFSSLSVEEKNALIKERPEIGRAHV